MRHGPTGAAWRTARALEREWGYLDRGPIRSRVEQAGGSRSIGRRSGGGTAGMTSENGLDVQGKVIPGKSKGYLRGGRRCESHLHLRKRSRVGGHTDRTIQPRQWNTRLFAPVRPFPPLVYRARRQLTEDVRSVVLMRRSRGDRAEVKQKRDASERPMAEHLSMHHHFQQLMSCNPSHKTHSLRSIHPSRAAGGLPTPRQPSDSTRAPWTSRPRGPSLSRLQPSACRRSSTRS